MNKYKYIDALFYALMVGSGEAFFTAYTLDLGYGELRASLIVTGPIVLGGIVQIIAPYFINKVQSFSKWTMAGAMLQALSFLLLIISTPLLKDNFVILFSLVSLYWIAGLAITPSWSSWLARIFQGQTVRHFFAIRNIFIAVGTVLGLVVSGVVLEKMPDEILGLSKYNFIFAHCFIFRLISFWSLSRHPKVDFKPIMAKLNLYQDAQGSFVRKFIHFSSLYKLGVFFSASFFAPYMLEHLKFNYIDFMLVLVSAYLGRVFMGQLMRKVMNNYDINKVYFFCSLGIALIPLCWIFLKDFNAIFFLEIFTGMLWGGFETAFLISCFEEVDADNQASLMVRYNAEHTFYIGVGSALGLSAFYLLGPSLNSYYLIFALSTVIRLLTLTVFPRKRIVNGEMVATYFIRFLGVRPNMGGVARPMWTFLKRKKKIKSDSLP